LECGWGDEVASRCMVVYDWIVNGEARRFSALLDTVTEGFEGWVLTICVYRR
jgi:hypothetical protein